MIFCVLKTVSLTLIYNLVPQAFLSNYLPFLSHVGGKKEEIYVIKNYFMRKKGLETRR